MLETKASSSTLLTSPPPKPALPATIKAAPPAKDTMDFLGFRNVSKVLVGDFQILIASLLFGFGFIGQRAVAVDGLGPMTCNAFRFTIGSIFIFIFLPLIDKPKNAAQQDAKSSTISVFRILFHKLSETCKDFLNRASKVFNSKLGSAPAPATATATAELITQETFYTNEVKPLLPATIVSGISGNNAASSPGTHIHNASNTTHLPHSSSSHISATSHNNSSISGSGGLVIPGLNVVLSADASDPLIDDDSGSEASEIGDLERGDSRSSINGSRDVDSKSNKYHRDLKNLKRNIMFWGIVLGLINFSGSGFQQWGIEYTTANKVAFISGFDLFFTPVLSFLIPTLKANGKVSINIWIAVFLSMQGLYLLSDMNISEFSMGHGEFFAMISALFWSLHIIYTDMATSYIDSIYMIAIQSLLVGVLSLILALCTESMPWFWYHFMLVTPWLFFLSIIEAVGLVMMIKGQKYSPPTHAAIITSLEGVFASMGSYLFLGEILSGKEVVGCILMLCAALVTEIKISFPTNSKKVDDEEGGIHSSGTPGKTTSSLIELNVSEVHTHRH
jgi:drug/metabolite transporter (DMT)-like permease